MTTKYTKEVLAPAVEASDSYYGVLRYLGLRPTGGSHGNIKKLVSKYGIDTSHFLGQGHARGGAAPNRLPPSAVLVDQRLSSGLRERPSILRRAMIESGVEELCEECGLPPTWRGKPLRLQVDHRNGDFLDNRPENVRFLCPNCHAQTPNFGVVNACR